MISTFCFLFFFFFNDTATTEIYPLSLHDALPIYPLTVSRPAGPFNRPTNLAVGPQGDLYVSDGYGNCRVHRFSPTGDLKQSWGVPGTGPGQFYLPHGIAVAADGRVFV